MPTSIPPTKPVASSGTSGLASRLLPSDRSRSNASSTSGSRCLSSASGSPGPPADEVIWLLQSVVAAARSVGPRPWSSRRCLPGHREVRDQARVGTVPAFRVASAQYGGRVDGADQEPVPRPERRLLGLALVLT